MFLQPLPTLGVLSPSTKGYLDSWKVTYLQMGFKGWKPICNPKVFKQPCNLISNSPSSILTPPASRLLSQALLLWPPVSCCNGWGFVWLPAVTWFPQLFKGTAAATKCVRFTALHSGWGQWHASEKFLFIHLLPPVKHVEYTYYGPGPC